MCLSVCLRACLPDHSPAHQEMNDYVPQTNGWTWKRQFFAYICMLTRYIHWSIFYQIVNIIDLHFQSQRFESSKLGSSYMIILQMVTDRTNIAISNTGSHIWPFWLASWHLTFAHSYGEGQDHAHFNCDCLANDDLLDKDGNCQHIGSCMCPFDWHIYIWLWFILKGNVEIMHISTKYRTHDER